MDDAPLAQGPTLSSLRPTWDEYFMQLTQQVGTRATCNRGKSGCVIVRDRQIVTTGYVGAPPGLPHCDDAGHLMRRVTDEDGVSREHCMRTIHAEQNAILQAARRGASVEGADLYSTMEPCRACAMFIVSAGIVRVVSMWRYHAAHESRELFAAAGVELVVLREDDAHYPVSS